MAIERTLAIIKPDAFGRGLSGEIVSRIQKAGFQIVAMKSLRLTKKEAEGFYAVHAARPFFGELTEFMSSGKWSFSRWKRKARSSSGVTRWAQPIPRKPLPGTIRRDLGTSIGNNCTHGSDAPETAAFELGYFFAGYELI